MSVMDPNSWETVTEKSAALTGDQIKKVGNLKAKIDKIRKYQRVFSTEEGKEILEELSRLFYDIPVCEPQPVMGPEAKHVIAYNSDPYRAFFLDGQRSVILHIKKIMEMDGNIDLEERKDKRPSKAKE